MIADLGVADAIGLDDEVAIEELAGRCGCDADALHRVLRLLEVHGIFRSEQRCWSHTPGSAVLRHDHPLSAKAYVRFLGQPGSWERVTQLAVSVRTGRPPLEFDEPDGPFAALASDAELLAFSKLR